MLNSSKTDISKDLTADRNANLFPPKLITKETCPMIGMLDLTHPKLLSREI